MVQGGDAAQEPRIRNRPLQMAVRALDRPVLVGGAPIVGGRPHALMGIKDALAAATGGVSV